MTVKLMASNGNKAVDLLNSDDPAIWNYFGTAPAREVTTIYSRVAAAFRAVNVVSSAAANVPFVLMQGAKEIDTSAHWQNEIGFIPNPRDLIRRLRMSLCMSNMGYLRMGKNQFNVPKKWNYTIPTSIQIVTDPVTGELLTLDRYVNGTLVKSYQPDDPDLVRFWYLDFETELLPSPHTEFKAIMNSANILYYADFFTSNFFQRGGIKPVLVAMKGLVLETKAEDIENKWTKFILGIGQRAKASVAKLFNADAIDVRPFGDGLGDLKETPVFRQALENIALGMGIPLSLLLSNSANYATAMIEERKFFRDNAVPWQQFIFDQMNEQVLMPMGYHFESRPEATDPEQEDEVQRASAISTFIDFLNKCPSADIALGAADTFGFELTVDLVEAIKRHYAAKESTPPPVSTQPAPPVTIEEIDDDEQEMEGEKAIYWEPNLNELSDLKIWRDVALRRWKKIQPMDFEYQPHHGGLPAEASRQIKAALIAADSMQAVRDAFDIRPVIGTRPASVSPDLSELAKALNRLADIQSDKPAQMPNINVNLTAQMPEVGASPVEIKADIAAPIVNQPPAIVTVNVPDLPAPVVNVNVPEQPAPVVNVTNEVRPAPVAVSPPRSAKVKRDRNGNITGLEAE